MALISANYGEWVDYRAAQITTFVGQVYDMVKKEHKGVLLSTAVFPEQGKSFGDKKQDFNTWLKRGYLDIITPMAYYDDIGTLKRALEAMLPGLSACYCYAGISPTYHNLSNDLVLKQMATTLEAGADGFVHFGSQSILQKPNYIKLLKENTEKTLRPHSEAKVLIAATVESVEKKLTAAGESKQNMKSLESARVKIAYQLTEFMRNGGIVTLSPHYPNPLDENPWAGSSIKGDLGHEDKWAELFTEGTEINTRFMGYLEQMGDFFEILQKNGAPVVFRNLLEMNGNWTWYCIGNTNADGVEKKLDPRYMKDLWILIYDYLVNERELNNLIWLYSPNVMQRGGGASTGDVMDCYPGDEYVDIVGVDWYPGETEQNNPDELVACYEDLVDKTGKIFVLGEFSAGGNRTVGDNYTFTTEDYDEVLERINDLGVKCAYTLAWSSWDTDEGRVKLTIYEMGMGDRFYYNNDTYLDQSETYELLYE